METQFMTTLSFQTEVKQLLHLMIHALYSNKEIFLRELISNASDAADRLRFEAISDDSLYENDPELRALVRIDPTARTITISDNGIGMGHQEVIDNLGTIAKSGTREFLANLTGDQSKDAKLIGQFGVGFYSSFIVADDVTVLTRKAGAPVAQGVRWKSNGEGEFTIETVEKKTHGTDIILHLRKEEDEFLDEWRLRQIIHKYSDHITLPVFMKKPVLGQGQEETSEEDEQVNRATALWTLRTATDEEYSEFYKHIAHDFEDPLIWAHNHVEGKQEYTSLLYIPSHAPMDMWQREQQHGLKLYIQRVFIMDNAEQFLPFYLRFVRGVIDSSDLPLNISREILQRSRVVDTLKKSLTKRVLSLLEKLAEDNKEKYAKFWREFGNVIKEGPIEDADNRAQIARLLRFASTYTDMATQDVSLDEYMKRMQPDQEHIFYITAENFNNAKNSPHLEIFRQRGIEVLLLSDRIDEWLLGNLTEFAGVSLQSITKSNVDLTKIENETHKKEIEERTQTLQPLVERLKNVLTDRIKEVKVSHRLTRSPACLVSDEHDMGQQMQRILKAAGQPITPTKPILELNPNHPFLLKLEKESDDEKFKEWSEILFDQAVLAEGGQLDDPAEFVQRLNRLVFE
jgi:molecular chaperone HtpG